MFVQSTSTNLEAPSGVGPTTYGMYFAMSQPRFFRSRAGLCLQPLCYITRLYGDYVVFLCLADRRGGPILSPTEKKTSRTLRHTNQSSDP
jgi:hypothetical protein